MQSCSWRRDGLGDSSSVVNGATVYQDKRRAKKGEGLDRKTNKSKKAKRVHPVLLERARHKLSRDRALGIIIDFM